MDELRPSLLVLCVALIVGIYLRNCCVGGGRHSGRQQCLRVRCRGKRPSTGRVTHFR